MVSWITWGQARTKLGSGQAGNILFLDNAYAQFGNAPDYRMFFNGADLRIEEIANAEHNIVFTAVGGVDIGLSAGQAFEVYNNDRAIFSVDVADVMLETYVEATVVLDTVDSLPLRFRGHYWTGAASANYDAYWYNEITAVDPTGRMALVINGNQVMQIDQEGSIDCFTSAGASRYYRENHLGATVADPGASGATKTELNAIFSYKLDAITEYLYFTTDLHNDWDGASDIEVDVYCYLSQAQNPNDLIRMSLLANYGEEHSNANAFQGQTITVDHNVEGFPNQGHVHIIHFVIPWDTGGQVIETLDTMHLRIWLDDITTAPVVTGVDVMHVNVKYRTSKPSIEV